MKPMVPISGMTCSSAAAALVEVSTTLPMAPRVLRRSVAPGLGHRVEHRLRVGDRVDGAHAGGDHVLGEVAVEQRPDHVRQRGRGARRGGDERVLRRVELVVVDAVDEDRRVRRQRRLFCLLLNGELCTTTAAPAARWPRRAPRGASASACGSRNVPVASTTRATPLSRHGMSLGLRASRRIEDLLAVGADEAAFLVHDVHVARAGAAEQEAVERAVGAVLGEVLDDRLERGAHRAAGVDDEAVEVVAAEVVPERELADAADAVDAEGALSCHPCGTSCRGADLPVGRASPAAARVYGRPQSYRSRPRPRRGIMAA